MVSRAESEEKKVIDPNSDEVSERAAKHIIEYVACSHFKTKNALLNWIELIMYRGVQKFLFSNFLIFYTFLHRKISSV